MKGSPRLLFYVQHLLGIGHVKRASLLVKGWLQAGFDVAVVAGGEPVAGVDFAAARVHQLPSLRAADSAFSALVDERGCAIDTVFKERRRDQLLEIFRQEHPDILVIESYPFGRRQLRWELLPLLETAHQRSVRPLVCSSVRDILQRRRPERVAESLDLVERYFDRVLVHGDAAFIPLEASLPECVQVADKLCYSGYVTDRATPAYQPSGDAEVLVSAGGGAVGFRLMKTALLARRHSVLADRRWRVLVGPNLPPEQLGQLQSLADEQVVIEPVRGDFTALLSRCALSISQGGYNTLMDVLAVGCPALLVPFEGEGETEQLTRCERLHAAGIGALVREAELTPAALCAAIEQALGGQERSLSLRCDGAARSAQQLYQHWQVLRG